MLPWLWPRASVRARTGAASADLGLLAPWYVTSSWRPSSTSLLPGGSVASMQREPRPAGRLVHPESRAPPLLPVQPVLSAISHYGVWHPLSFPVLARAARATGTTDHRKGMQLVIGAFESGLLPPPPRSAPPGSSKGPREYNAAASGRGHCKTGGLAAVKGCCWCTVKM